MFDNEIFGTIYFDIVRFNYLKLINEYSGDIAKETIEQFIEVATLPLFRQSWERVLLVEMHLANADNLLDGSTEFEQFEFFIREVIKPENFTCLLKKYPQLWERWQAQFSHYCESLNKFLSRAVADKNAFADHLYGDRIVRKITKITPVGDPHQGMQQTLRVEYINECDQPRIVYYKPHPLDTDVGLRSFFNWWNQYFDIDHIVPAVLARAEYGWAREIPHQSCETEEQVVAYYQRYGSLVALCYLFGATDLHKDNLIACGEYPVIVDCETMFSCTLAVHKDSPSDTHLYASWLLPAQKMQDSIEISPLSARSNQQTEIKIRFNPQRRISTTKLEIRKLVTGHSDCEVLLGDKLVEDFIEYSDHIVEGMRLTLQFIEKNRIAVLNKTNECMRGAAVRILFRATNVYVGALRNSWHPDSLYKRETELDLLKLVDPTSDAEVLQSELSQLRNGDVPYFLVFFDKPEVLDGNGQNLELPLSKTPQQKIEHQFSRLSPQFIEQLIKDLEYALFSYRLRRGDKYIKNGSRFTELTHLSDTEWLEALSVHVHNQVLDQALQLEAGYYYWRTIGVADQAKLQAGLTDIHLYDGLAGIALAYHIVGARLHSEPYNNFSHRLTVQIVKQLIDSGPAKLGALTGTAGTLWSISYIQKNCLTKLSSIVEKELYKLSYQLITYKWEKYEQLDYVSGAAGSLSMLLRLHRLFRNYPIAADISQLASYLFTIMKNEAVKLRDEDTLLGYAHGTAGVSAVLAEYMTYFGVHDSEAVILINDNVMRETRFRSAQGWPHLSNKLSTNTSWCHGTVGFGFSRLHLRPYIPANIYEEDMQVIRQRLGEPQASVGLCHGMMADYYLERALGETGNHALNCVRREIARDGLTTHFGLNNFEIVGAMTGVTSLFVGDALFSIA